MNLPSFYIGLAILALVIIPFAIGAIKRKSAAGRAANEFNAHALKYAIEISEIDLWKNRIIGMDSVRAKVLFKQNAENEFSETLVDLSRVSESFLNVVYLKESGNQKLIDRIEIVIKMEGKEPEIKLSFYDSEHDKLVADELVLGEKWARLIHESIR